MVDQATRTVRVYVVEEQEIYREVYKTVLYRRSGIELLGISADGALGAVPTAVSAHSPDVLLAGIKKLDNDIVEELSQIRAYLPKVGVVLLLMVHDPQSIPLLRKLAVGAEAGTAVFLKQSLERIDQLRGIIMSVSEGQFILDPVLASLLFAEKHECPSLRELTTRELEILSLMAKGYTNSALAEALYIDIRTVQHHINSVYSKFKAEAGFSHLHPRVSAARLYLETMGELLTTGVPE